MSGYSWKRRIVAQKIVMEEKINLFQVCGEIKKIKNYPENAVLAPSEILHSYTNTSFRVCVLHPAFIFSVCLLV